MRRHVLHIFALFGLLGLIIVTQQPVGATAPPPGSIDTFAGGGTLTGEGIPATSAQFAYTWGIAVSSAGDVFVSDPSTCTVKKISGGLVTTAVGTVCPPSSPYDAGDGGPATLARLRGRAALAMDAADNLHIADLFGCAIRKVEARTGTITTIAGRGPSYCGGVDVFNQGVAATSVPLLFPSAIAVGPDGSIYFSEPRNCNVRKVADGIITTFAGSRPLADGTCGALAGDGGPATSASLKGPQGIAVDASGNVYIADQGHCRVREVSAGIITSVAGVGYGCYYNGDGDATTRSLEPVGLAIEPSGDLLITDTLNCLVRRLSGGMLTTVAGFRNDVAIYTLCGFSGDGGSADGAKLNGPIGVAVDTAGNAYISDLINGRVRIVYGATPPATSLNVSPTLSVPAAQSVTVGSSLSFTVSATDANTDPLVLSAFGLPAGLTFVDHHDGTGSVAGAAAAAPGTYHAEFWASDGTIPATAGTVDIVVIPPGYPPTLVVPPSLSVQYSDPVSFSIAATDPEADPITIGAAGLPAGVSFVDHGDGTGSISGVVTAPAGTYTATFSAKDIWNAPTVRNVTITVQPEDAMITYTGDLTKPAGSLLTVSAKVVDAADGSPGDLTKLAVTFNVHGLVSGLNLSSNPVPVNASGIASFTFPTALDPNVYEIVVVPDSSQYFAAPALTVDVGVYNRAASESGAGWVLDGGNKADFSFNAKYGKGDRVEGQFQYTYRLGGQTIKLRSDRLQWLVVLGNVGVLRGTATLNGVPGYVFELTVIDNGPGGTDSLGLNIWAADGSIQHVEPPSVLGGGSAIVRAH